VKLRLAALGLLLALAFVIASAMGWRDWLTPDRLQHAVVEAGWWGVVLFFIIFSVGQLMQVPGVVFIIAARAAWGPTLGFFGAYVGAVMSATFVFVLVRAIGGRPLGEITWAPARRILAGLERRPVLTIAALRAVMMLAPPLNYAFALSPIRQRHHLLGSAIGLVLPVGLVVFLSEVALRWLA
jgi:uncharacterized membrane protein YdjX (TVP38/TMEM64 family)